MGSCPRKGPWLCENSSALCERVGLTAARCPLCLQISDFLARPISRTSSRIPPLWRRPPLPIPAPPPPPPLFAPCYGAAMAYTRRRTWPGDPDRQDSTKIGAVDQEAFKAFST